jgi:primosomal protein N' (replication factor Y)
MTVAGVWVKGTNYSFDRVYDYVLPEGISAAVGCRVVVPFGKGEKSREAIIAAITEMPETVIREKKLKSILRVADDSPILSNEALETAAWMKTSTLCTYYDAAKCFLPPGESVSLSEKPRKTRKKVSETKPEKTEPNSSAFVLNNDQTAAYDGISALIKSGKPSATLLYGVTGSGKTAVFIKLIEDRVKSGQSVIMLVPEIALTPQLTAKFADIFGNRIALLHSGLTNAARAKEFYRIKNSEADIVIGTRSAVFAPAKNLGLIIIDEESEHTYISESTPRYSAKEVAKKRCAENGAALVLASATPSVESYYYAKTGRYSLFTLAERFSKNDSAALPAVEIVDIYRDNYYADSTVFSEKLAEAIYANLEKGEQTILLLNRRGYNTVAVCRSCKNAVICPNCSVPLTFHRDKKKLLCHYCGFAAPKADVCPKCGSETLSFIGTGTQKIEEELGKYFASARILRMDADTVTDRGTYERSFAAFENGEYDIMLGTQMIAKGLDFPNVTLSAVISADAALYTGDFRSYERTFSLITQLTGRSGRGTRPGKAIIQTSVPSHYILSLAAAQDYPAFYREEIEARKLLLYPPFCGICSLAFISAESERAKAASRFFAERLKQKMSERNPDFPLRILGPEKHIIEKIGGKYRYNLLLKTRFCNEFRTFIAELYAETYTLKEYAKTVVTVDFN